MNTITFFGATFFVDRVAFSIGSFEIYWYGVIIATGLLAAMVYAFRRAPSYGINTDGMIDVILVGAVSSIICARAYYVLTTLDQYTSLWDALDIRNGGIAIYGAVIGAFLGGGIMCRIRKINLWDMFDLAACGFLLGQAIGRWGNFINQEAFGCNTTLPWGMYSTRTYDYLSSVQSNLAAQGITVDPNLPVHPCFLYESLWCIAGFVLLHFLSHHRHFKGETLLQYLVWYGLGRFFIEGLRTDSLMVGSFRISQIVAAACVVVGIVLLIVLNRKAKVQNETVGEVS